MASRLILPTQSSIIVISTNKFGRKMPDEFLLAYKEDKLSKIIASS
jgi:hypothetical protein